EDSGGTVRANHAFVNYGNGKSDFFTWATHDGSSLAERVRITKEGKVGIGTDNPDALSSSANNLVIADFGGEGGMTIKTNVNSAGNIFFADADGSATGRIAYGHGATDAGDYMRFYVNSEERVRIRHDGKVGVGTNLSSSTYKFEVWDDTSATFMVRKGNTSRIVLSNDST
ncbi:MAG: hypothetical protein VXY93_22445, partial [Pseudomonadota bacterium]|nr:hypothetical protein [Pseudomonadota bacterium]